MWMKPNRYPYPNPRTPLKAGGKGKINVVTEGQETGMAKVSLWASDCLTQRSVDLNHINGFIHLSSSLLRKSPPSSFASNILIGPPHPSISDARTHFNMASGLFSTHRPINGKHVELYTGRATMDPRSNCVAPWKNGHVYVCVCRLVFILTPDFASRARLVEQSVSMWLCSAVMQQFDSAQWTTEPLTFCCSCSPSTANWCEEQQIIQTTKMPCLGRRGAIAKMF